TRLLTISLKAAPMITPTARSTTLPRAMNSRNSEKMLIGADPPPGLAFVFDVQPLAQLLATLEERNVLGAHIDRFAGARIAAGARVAGPHGKRAEAAKLD